MWSSCLSTNDQELAGLAQPWPTCQRTALAGPAVVLSSGVLDDFERIGALLRQPECSALVLGVVELSQHKRPEACGLGPVGVNIPMHGVSGAGSSHVEWCA